MAPGTTPGALFCPFDTFSALCYPPSRFYGPAMSTVVLPTALFPQAHPAVAWSNVRVAEARREFAFAYFYFYFGYFGKSLLAGQGTKA